jgi:hypothetical protein
MRDVGIIVVALVLGMLAAELSIRVARNLDNYMEKRKRAKDTSNQSGM